MLDLTQEQRLYIKDTLTRFLPNHVNTFAFGSRTKGKARATSDLDLLLISPNKIPPQILAQLNEEFADSDLAFPIDLIEQQAISDDFYTHIKPDLVLLLSAHQRDNSL